MLLLSYILVLSTLKISPYNIITLILTNGLSQKLIGRKCISYLLAYQKFPLFFIPFCKYDFLLGTITLQSDHFSLKFFVMRESAGNQIPPVFSEKCLYYFFFIFYDFFNSRFINTYIKVLFNLYSLISFDQHKHL